MKIYVAGKFEEKETVRRVQTLCRALGHEITHDWTDEDKAKALPGRLDEYLGQCAREDLDGVRRADAVVALLHPRGKGLWVEVGVALALGKKIFALGASNCIFLKLPGVLHREDDLSWLATELGSA